jgi:glutathione S-transferase
MLVLYVEPQWISPYVFSCFVALTEKELDFEARVLDAAKGETRTADYLERTVTGRVPALLHDDFGLAESTAIVEYLEDVFPTPRVLPSSPAARARCRQLMSWLRSDDTLPIRAERPTHTMFLEPTSTPLSAEATSAARKLNDVAERLIASPQRYLFDEWSIADADLAFMLHRLIQNGDAVPPKVKEWAEAAWERPSVQAFVKRERPRS